MILGINRKVILLTFSIILVFGFALGYYIIRYQTRILKLELDERINVLMDNLSTISEYPVLIRDKESITRLTKGVMSQKDIVFCRVEDMSGDFFYEESSEDAGPVSKHSTTIVVKNYIEGIDEDLILGTSKEVTEIIGMIHLGVSHSSLNRKLHNVKMVMAVTIIITIFTTCLTIYILLKRILGRPIYQLVKATENISKGNLKNKVPIGSKDEIGVLAASFNRMIDNLLETTVSKDYVENILNNMRESLLVISPSGLISTVNQNILELLGYTEDEIVNKPVDMIFEEAKDFIKWRDDVSLAKRATIRNRETFYITKDSNKIPVLFSASVMLDPEGSIQGIICVAVDITERKRSESRMQDSLREKEVLLKEVHHRVKNNLQVVISLLSLQSQYVKDQNAIQMLQECQDRVNSIAIIHEKIYHSKDLSKIKLKEYVEDLANNLFVSYKISTGKVRLKLDIENISLGIDTSIPCGLIINELMSNSLKYAFPGNRAGEVEIIIHKMSNGEIGFIFSDNGIGLSDMIDFKDSPGFGFRMIVDLVEFKLMGEIKQIQDKGTKFEIRFKEIV
ncbi:MAG: PAS domain-containing protein [Candidatus Scalindua sp.]|jgi:PAS domain S-box-containing protein|nr:PAS domain-containing protein [Candidatus Scalindua sp.]MBT5307601.1 PAS domain-containing protein [Candidatus Scalindua sp.]MBT6053471.1 PAS domain-containing protein [Candidatus Scalindua sp.]MBT6228766.1 PAS domain-containing protein [Candidatus Scalindua sp.]MBT6564268.1 PAS domain-containing protein [Candidatus Scalindua sp.]